MALTYSTSLRNAQADAISAAIGDACLIRLYTAPRPAHVADAATGTLLAELTGGTPFAAAAINGILSANAIEADPGAAATGDAAWFRCLQSDGTTAVIDGSVTATGGGGDLTMPSVTITIGEPVEVTSCTITMAGS